MNEQPLIARALQLAERIDLKGLERAEQFSSNPLAFKVAGGGTVVLFRFGSAVFFGLNPLEEEGIVAGLQGRIIEPLADRESETVQITFLGDGEDQPLPNGSIELKDAAPERLLLVAEALAVSVALAYDERRIARAFDRVEGVASNLKKRKLMAGSQADLVEQIGEALLMGVPSDGDHQNPRWLFPNKAGDGPIGRGALGRAFAIVAREAGITGSTPHSLRHRYATRLIERGINLRVVQILPGTATYCLQTVDRSSDHLSVPSALWRDGAYQKVPRARRHQVLRGATA